MENKGSLRRFLPMFLRLAVLVAVYHFLIIPLSSHLINQDTEGGFLTLFIINILFIVPLILFVSFSGFADDVLNLLGHVSRYIDTLNKWVGHGVAWVTLLVVVVVFVDVVMRYALKISFVFTQELEWHLFAFIFLMGAGYTLMKDGHVRVDIIYQRCGPKTQAWINFIGVILFLMPGCYMVIATSINFVYNAWSVLEGSPDPGGIPYRFIIKSAIPAGFFLITLQGFSLAVKSLFTILGKDMEKDQKSYRMERDCRS